MSEARFGDYVEFPKGSKRTALVVDVNVGTEDGYCSTPLPNLVIAWKVGSKVKEGVVQTQYVRKVSV